MHRAIASIAAAAAIGVVCISVAYVNFPLGERKPATGAKPHNVVEAPKPPTGAPAPAIVFEPPARPKDIATVPAAEPMTVPTFDVVLVDPNGEGVLAGRAGAKWQVELESENTKIAEATADEQGEWSIILDRKLSPGDHRLSLRTVSPDGTRLLTSQQSVAVTVGNAKDAGASLTKPEAQVFPPAPVEHAPDSTSAPSGSGQQTQTSATEAAPTPVPRPAINGIPAGTDMSATRDMAAPVEPQPLAVPAPQQDNPVIAKPEPTPTQVPQVVETVPPGQSSIPPVAALGADQQMGASPQSRVPMDSVSAPSLSPGKTGIVFKTVEYQDIDEDTGKIKLAGTSAPGGTIQLQIDNKPLTRVTSDRLGQWSADVDKKLGEGRHSFRAEEIGEAGGASSSQATVSIELRLQAIASVESTETPTLAGPPAPMPTDAKHAEKTGMRLAPSQQTAGVEAATDAKAERRPSDQHKKTRPQVYTVRRGDTLWDLAERYLGGGWRYTSIFRGNRRVIKDPDEILPRQKVTLPKH